MKKLVSSLLVALGIMCIMIPTKANAKKYDYSTTGNNGNNAYDVKAGSNYDTSNGYVGCPSVIYTTLTVKSIAKEGFIGWAKDHNAVAKIPDTCDSVGKNAFYSTILQGEQSKYLGGATMPAKFWRYYEYMGFTAYTPLKNNNGTIVCDTSSHTPITYNGQPQVPESYAVYIDGEAVSSVHEFLTTDLTNVGEKTVRFPVQDITTGNFNVSGVFYGTTTYSIAPYNIENAEYENGVDETYTYTGNPIQPIPHINGGWGTLSEQTDYTLNYTNNVNVGNASVSCVTGKNNNYTGSKTMNFTIEPATIESDTELTIKEAPEAYTFTGSPITPSAIVTWNGRELVEGQDYDVTYYDNVNVGSATMRVTGKGNFEGIKETQYIISPLELTEENVVITGISPEYQYDDESVQPEPIITWNGKVLEENVDYSLEYNNTSGIGTATVTITGIDNFKGSIIKSYNIVKELNKSDDDIIPSDDATNENGERVDQLENTELNTIKMPDGNITATTTKTLKWKKVKKAKRYIVYKKKGKKWKKVKTVKANKLKVTMNKGTKISFKIVGQKKKGKKWKAIKTQKKTLKT